MADTNLTIATRNMIDKSWKSQLMYKMPVLKLLLERKRFRMGGLMQQNINETADTEELVQEYGPEDGLTASSKTTLGTAAWGIAFMTHPLLKTIDEEIMNAPAGDARLINLAKKHAGEVYEGLRRRLNKRIWGCAGDIEIDARHTLFQGIGSALNYTSNLTYAGITKSTSTYWYSADYSTINTAYTMSIRQLRTWISSVKLYHETASETLKVIMGTTLFLSLKSEMDARNIYKPTGNMAKQGFMSMELDGVEIVEDPYLDLILDHSVYHRDGSDAGIVDGVDAKIDANGSTVVALLHLDSWVFRYIKGGGEDSIFSLTDFFDLSVLPGGVEKELARAKFRGNLECHQPNVNMLRVNVTG